MKTAIKVISLILSAAVIISVGFVVIKCSQGISYDASAVENIGTDVEIISEDIDTVVLKKSDTADFKVLMFTDTHLNGKKTQDAMTVEYIVRNVTAHKPDLVIFGGDNISSGFSKKRTEQFCEIMEKLGVYWAAVFGNHEGDGFLSVSREENVEIFSSYSYCLMCEGKEDVDGNGNYSLVILNADDTVKQVIFLMDSGSYMTKESKQEYGVTEEGEVYDGVKASQVKWYEDKHNEIEAAYGKFKSVTVVHIPPYQTEEHFEGSELIFGEKREGICESGFDAGLFDAMTEKGSAQAVFFGHDHVNDFAYEYDGIRLSYIQTSGYGVYNMESKFGAPENEWIQGCTLVTFVDDGSFVEQRILNHQ